MTKTQSVYLSTSQIATLNNLGLLGGAFPLRITMGDLLQGGEFAGHIVVEASTRTVHLDRAGEIVENAS